MPSIIILDTYYPEVITKLGKPTGSYDDRQTQLMNLFFGTADYYSRAFSACGWKAKDLVANDIEGRLLWNKEYGPPYSGAYESVIEQIKMERPNVLYCQDLSFIRRGDLDDLRYKYKILVVSQHSCPWAGDDQVQGYDFVFTSFPHYTERLQKLGVEHDFLQIGFGGQRILDALHLKHPENRPIGASFVGGIGQHWTRSNKMFDTLAKRVDEFSWWGYGKDNLPDCLFKRIWQGEAWGLDMYRVYARSKIVINRHGEIAEPYSNNMRMFEATGCGALLMTEHSKNINVYFEPDKECITYHDTDDLIQKVQYYLKHDEERDKIARAGYRRTMNQHTYGTILSQVDGKLRFIIGEQRKR